MIFDLSASGWDTAHWAFLKAQPFLVWIGSHADYDRLIRSRSQVPLWDVFNHWGVQYTCLDENPRWRTH
jgi:hypothetical protein